LTSAGYIESQAQQI